MHSLSSKEFANSKSFGDKRGKAYKFNILLKGEFTKYSIAGGPSPNLYQSNDTTYHFKLILISCPSPFKSAFLPIHRYFHC
jgi:hypothetical protein